MPLAKLGTNSAPSALAPIRRERAEVAIKKLQLRLHPDAWRRLKTLALDENTSLEALGIEAFSLLFERRGLLPLETPES